MLPVWTIGLLSKECEAPTIRAPRPFAECYSAAIAFICAFVSAMIVSMSVSS